MLTLDQELPIVEMLYEAEAPILWVSRVKWGKNPTLVYAYGELDGESRFISTSLTWDDVDLLKEGILSVRDAVLGRTGQVTMIHSPHLHGVTRGFGEDVGHLNLEHIPREGLYLTDLDTGYASIVRATVKRWLYNKGLRWPRRKKL